MSDQKSLSQVYGDELAVILQDSLDAMDTLSELAETDVPRLPESRFKQVLLPILTSEEPHQDMEIWLSIAGTPMRAIDVVSDSTGEVLFRVPPMLRRTDTLITRQGNGTAFEILSVAKQKHEVLPALGKEYIRDHLINVVGEDPVAMEQLQQWSDILVRYGYDPLIDAPEEKKEEVATQGGLADIQTGEYDDL